MSLKLAAFRSDPVSSRVACCKPPGNEVGTYKIMTDMNTVLIERSKKVVQKNPMGNPR